MKLFLLLVVVSAVFAAKESPKDRKRHVALIGDALIAPPPPPLITPVFRKAHPIIEPHPFPIIEPHAHPILVPRPRIPHRIIPKIAKYLPPNWDNGDGTYQYEQPQCPIIERDGPAICVDECTADPDCPRLGDKCCTNGCGTRCIRAVIPRRGKCPQPTLSYECKHGNPCTEDAECHHYEKCCNNDCGSTICRPAIHRDA